MDGDRPEIDASSPEPCDQPGSTERVACGNCGQVERFCTAERTWVYGECEGERACAPGTERSAPCGNCGTQTERCSASCEWQVEGTCADQGVCAPGTRSRSGDGCDEGETREVLCSDACAFAPAGECIADRCETPGASERVPCGNCGETTRFCTAQRVWTYDACTGEGACAPGSVEMGACGNCGSRMRRCTTECAWDDSGACTDEGECVPGSMTRSSTGCEANQSRLLTCSDACEYVEGACEALDAGMPDAGPPDAGRLDAGPIPRGCRDLDVLGRHHIICDVLGDRAVAANVCAGRGMHLATIESQTQNDMLAAAGTPEWRYWIGLTDGAPEGHYVWDSTGTATPSFRRWAEGEPNAMPGENCVHLWTWAAAWNDDQCTVQDPRTGFICN